MRPPSSRAKMRLILYKAASFAFFASAALAFFAIPTLVLGPVTSILHEANGKNASPDEAAQGSPDRWKGPIEPEVRHHKGKPASLKLPRFPTATYGHGGGPGGLAKSYEQGHEDHSMGDRYPWYQTQEGPWDTEIKDYDIASNGDGQLTEANKRGGMSTSLTETAKKERYLLFIQHSGLSNQLINFRKAAKLAALYNRTLIASPLQSSHLKQRPVIIDKAFSKDGEFVDVEVQEAELAKPENNFRVWLEIVPNVETTRNVVSLQEYVNQTRQSRFRCWNVQDNVSLRRVDGFLPWRRTVEEEDVLCIGRPYKISIYGRFVADYIRFSKAVRSVGDAWLARNGLGLGKQHFIGAHIRRGDFGIYYCEKKNFPLETCNPTYGQMFEHVEDIGRRALSSLGDDFPPEDGMRSAVPVVFMTNERRKEELAAMVSRGWLRFSPTDSDIRLFTQHAAELGIPGYGENGDIPRQLTTGELSMLSILVDQYIGTQATYFVGNKHSTFTLVIWQFRDCRKPIACEHWGEPRVGESEDSRTEDVPSNLQ